LGGGVLLSLLAILASARIPAFQLTADDLAGPVDRAVDQGSEVGIVVLDHHVGKVLEVDEKATAMARAGALPALVGKVDLDANDAMIESSKGKVQTLLQVSKRLLIDRDPLTPDFDLHDKSPRLVRGPAPPLRCLYGKCSPLAKEEKGAGR
jgi:hypothetical protein